MIEMRSSRRNHNTSPIVSRTVALLAIVILILAATIPSTRIRPIFADSFGQHPTLWEDFFCIDGEICRVGDVNGDGRDDILTFVRSTQGGSAAGDVYVALSDGGAFRPTNTKWQDFFCVGGELCKTGDVDGDGRDDIIAFVRSSNTVPGREGDVYVALSTGTSFGPSGDQWQEFFCVGEEVCDVGDFNGDGKDDLVTFVRNTATGGREGDVYVALSTGTSFGPSGDQWKEAFCLGDRVCGVGDFNGDGRDDIVSFVRDSAAGGTRGDVYVALSTGSGFGVGLRWQEFFCVGTEVCGTADVNGDGLDDIVTFIRDAGGSGTGGDVYVALSDGTQFGAPQLWQGSFCIGEQICDVGDFDGDSRDDVVAFARGIQGAPGQGNVYVGLSTTADFLPVQVYLPLIIK